MATIETRTGVWQDDRSEEQAIVETIECFKANGTDARRVKLQNQTIIEIYEYAFPNHYEGAWKVWGIVRGA
jgi:hypothetical protein